MERVDSWCCWSIGICFDLKAHRCCYRLECLGEKHGASSGRWLHRRYLVLIFFYSFLTSIIQHITFVLIDRTDVYLYACKLSGQRFITSQVFGRYCSSSDRKHQIHCWYCIKVVIQTILSPRVLLNTRSRSTGWDLFPLFNLMFTLKDSWYWSTIWKNRYFLSIYEHVSFSLLGDWSEYVWNCLIV